MNAYERAYPRLVGRGFCHFSSNEMDQYVRRARWRVLLAVAFVAVALLTYLFVAVRPI